MSCPDRCSAIQNRIYRDIDLNPVLACFTLLRVSLFKPYKSFTVKIIKHTGSVLSCPVLLLIVESSVGTVKGEGIEVLNRSL